MSRVFRRLRPALAIVAGVLALPLAWASLGGGGFQLSGEVLGGGGASAGGGFTLIGSIPPAGQGASSGGGFQIRGGILGVLVVPNPRVPLKVLFTSDKLALLSWPEGTTGHVLEFSPAVGPIESWTPVDPQPTGNTFLTPCQQPARFFRLRPLP